MRKALISLFLAFLFSCENKITEKGRNEALTNQTENQLQTNKQTTQNQVVSEPNYISDKKYSFVVFEGDGFFSYEGQKRVVTDVFETNAFMDKDQEYKVLDEAQQKSMINLELRHLDKRYIKTFDTYAEASEERERLLGINNSETIRENKKEDYSQSVDTAASSPYYIVNQPKAYFYSKPNKNKRKNTYLLYGAKIFVSDET
ncbi:hypothetical protein [Flavobacterium oreochromis]|uniref:hypothetical protein n=1 Tax=Flavobacterium oreochromis TaxID=2906078 RepID=UPI001F28F7C6|nr:hypothetical protein [Flavobacterium oreochromis]